MRHWPENGGNTGLVLSLRWLEDNPPEPSEHLEASGDGRVSSRRRRRDMWMSLLLYKKRRRMQMSQGAHLVERVTLQNAWQVKESRFNPRRHPCNVISPRQHCWVVPESSKRESRSLGAAERCFTDTTRGPGRLANDVHPAFIFTAEPRGQAAPRTFRGFQVNPHISAIPSHIAEDTCEAELFPLFVREQASTKSCIRLQSSTATNVYTT